MAETAIRQKESHGREKHAGKPHGERWWDLRIPQIGTPLDLLPEVIDRQRLTVDFAIFYGVAKSSRLKLRNQRLGVRASPDAIVKHWETGALIACFTETHGIPRHREPKQSA